MQDVHREAEGEETMKRFIILLFAFALWVPSVFAVGAIVRTSTALPGSGHTKYTLAWTSDASGDVSGNGFIVPKGNLKQALFIPGTGGDIPDDLYDATFTYNGVDLLNTVGGDLSQTTSKLILFNPPIFYDATSNLDLVIAAAGAANKGTFIFWMVSSR